MTKNPLGRTQQAGQGTAFIYDPISNANPIDKLYNYVLTTQQQKANKDKLLADKDKLLADKGADLRTEILKISDKLRQHDLPTAQKYQNEIFDWLKEQGGDAFDPMNPAFSELNKKLAQLNSFAGASQALREQEKILQSKYNTNPNKYDINEYNRLNENIFSKPTEYILQNADNPDFNINIKERLLTPQQLIKESKYLPIIQNTIAKYKPLINDKDVSENMQKEIDAKEKEFIYNVYSDLFDKQQNGLMDSKYTAQELMKIAEDNVKPLMKDIYYDPNKDEDQAQKQKQHNDMMAYRWSSLDFQKSKTETQPTYAYENLVRVSEGEGSNIEFSGTPYLDVNLALEDGQGGYTPSMIGKIEQKIKKSDGSENIKVQILQPYNDNGSIKTKTTSLIVPYKDNKGNIVIQNSALYNSIQQNAINKNISYSNIGGKETKVGTKNPPQPTSKTSSGFPGNKENTKPIKTPQKATEKKYIFKNGKLILE